MNKPKINGKSFLKAIEKCERILERMTYNSQSPVEREIYDILCNETTKAYLVKKY